MTNLHDARVEAAARAINPFAWKVRDKYMQQPGAEELELDVMVAESLSLAAAAIAAADTVVTESKAGRCAACGGADQETRTALNAELVSLRHVRNTMRAVAEALRGRYTDNSGAAYYMRQIEEALDSSFAADAVVTVDGLQERIKDTLAYYQCRETNPKADHPSMGYHAFSEEQREWLRSKKSEAAAEIVRMIHALLRGGEER